MHTMITEFENYYTTLEALTDAELDRSAETLVARENANIAKLIAHLAEMSERKTALLAEVLGVVNAEKNMAAVMDQALELALEKKDPKKRLERRVQREKRQEARRPRPNDVADKEGAPSSRHVPADTRDRVHAKGDYQ